MIPHLSEWALSALAVPLMIAGTVAAQELVTGDTLNEAVKSGGALALVILILIPILKWLLNSMSQSNTSRDALVTQLLENNTNSLDAMTRVVEQFKFFREEQRAATRRVDALLTDLHTTLERLRK